MVDTDVRITAEEALPKMGASSSGWLLGSVHIMTKVRSAGFIDMQVSSPVLIAKHSRTVKTKESLSGRSMAAKSRSFSARLSDPRMLPTRRILLHDLLKRLDQLFDSMRKVEASGKYAEEFPSKQAIDVAQRLVHQIYSSYKRVPDKVAACVDDLVALQYGNDPKFHRFEIYSDGDIVLLTRHGADLQAEDIAEIAIPSLLQRLFARHA